MSYLGELRDNFRPLAAAFIGCGGGGPLMAFTTGIYGPHLIHDFGWSRAQFALIGLTQLVPLLILPFVGRFTDRLGVFRVAVVGVVLVPLVLVAYSLQQGSFGYFALCSVLMVSVGSIAGPLVYMRLVAENFQRAQGLALTIVNCAPAAVGVFAAPALTWCIARYGWRVGYLSQGALVLIAGAVALALARTVKPKVRDDETPVRQMTGSARRPGSARDDFGVIVRSSIFWIIAVAIFLCVLQTPLHASQMTVMLLENGITPAQAATAISVYAFGTIVGRLACGLALDRYSTPIVSAVSLVVPAVGFLLLASDLNTLPVIVGSMFIVGLSVGAESDIVSFLVARYFQLRIYNSTLSLFHCATYAAGAIAALLVSASLKLTDSFSPFLYLTAGAVTVGGLLCLLLPRSPDFEKVG